MFALIHRVILAAPVLLFTSAASAQVPGPNQVGFDLSNMVAVMQ